MSEQYLPVIIQVLAAIGFAGAALVASVVLGRTAGRNPTKDSPYECGMPVGKAEPPRFSVKFYLVAMLFILFDIEVVFMYPWAVVFRDLVEAPGGGAIAFWSMFGFVGLITVGYVYAIAKGVLNWQR